MSFDDAFTFNEVQTKSKKFTEHTIGKSTKKRVRGYFHSFLNRYITPLNDRNATGGPSIASMHGRVLALAACVLSVPYDMPSWLPEHATLLARFVSEPSPVKSTVTKAVAEFRWTHAAT